MRTKIPQLREALAKPLPDRASRHHGRPATRAHRHARRRDSQNLTRTDRARAHPARRDRRAAVHDPRRPGPRRAGPDRRVRPRHERCSRQSGTSPRGPARAQAITNQPAADARDEPAPDRAGSPTQLTECARAAVRTKGTYLAAHSAQLRGRRGEPKAIGAIRHDILVAYYHIVRDQAPFRELGPDWQRKRYSVRAPRPPTPTPTRSARIRRHPRPSRTTSSRPSRLNRRHPKQVSRRRIAGANDPCPNAVVNTGIHRSASSKRGSPARLALAVLGCAISSTPI